jgi:hypothetical protein
MSEDRTSLVLPASELADIRRDADIGNHPIESAEVIHREATQNEEVTSVVHIC